MSVETFRKAVESLLAFLTDSEVDAGSKKPRRKVIGMIGGEPLLHPDFEKFVKIMHELIPHPSQRGLWTGLDWRNTKYANIIQKTFKYINENRHDKKCVHSPVLVSISDVLCFKHQRDVLIDNCWLQRLWSGSITPKGYFFCEVAGALDMVFNGPGGLPIEPGCWNRPLSDFQDQIDRWCHRCGISMNLEGRLDSDELDDVSSSNLDALRAIGSPRLDRCIECDGPTVMSSKCPWRYSDKVLLKP